MRRVNLLTRPDETEEQRRARVRKEAGSRHTRDTTARRADAKARHENLGSQPKRVWPPEPTSEWRRNLDPCEKARRVDEFFEGLEGLTSCLHVCPNCLELDCEHGAEGPTKVCAQCDTFPDALCESNGLLLDMVPYNPKYPRVIERSVKIASCRPDQFEIARERWQDLQYRHGGLRVLEEALISPVIACRGVLRMPSGVAQPFDFPRL